ncbi:hypothetical protein TTHERM_00225630 (macronuclear) [Tetrahymena thermophila SB210]|uniref:Uncharacterized protein n=1 Tax=Tetrahymena thermophila (strain SB210) TaxID=312017 RepID=Q23C19_TETTS|nr:hypothetical protein TTHERM_00225630 [Tetrahymena thermophila SB210]EAR93949.3 hypothetical protein TTHERM_00225630 [Tetrahymena thermophila SB210]|eukprot:XP_001014194.3 hypothetical protein TTHERM_00225630 [Tetrahymena thermophila SB210]
MPPKKSGQSRGNQRQANQQKSKPISEYTDYNLYEQLSRENCSIEEILDQIKDVDDQETKENILQNFVQLIFKLVGLNSFVIKLEDKQFSSIDQDFFKSEIESNLKNVKDFNWVFTTRKEEHQFLKDNLFIFFDSILQQSQYYKSEKKDDSFMVNLSNFLIMLSKSHIQNVRQNVLRLVRIIVEQGLIRIEKLRAAQQRKLQKEEQYLKNILENIMNILIKGIFHSRILDKSQSIQQDCIESFEIFFNISPQMTLNSQNLIQLCYLFDSDIDLANALLKVLINIKWKETESSLEALKELVQYDKFRKRLIYFSNISTFVTSYRAIQLVNLIDEILPGSLNNKDLKRAMATIFHKYEEVRAEGFKILQKFLEVNEGERQISVINLEGGEDDGVSDIFQFKQQTNSLACQTFIKKFYTLLDEVDSKIYEKEDLIQNMINSLGFEFGAIYDFQNIFQLLNQLPSSNLKDKIFDLFKLIVIILKKTMKFLQLISQGENPSSIYNQKQSEKLLIIRNEFFKALVANFDNFYENMNKHPILKEYSYQLLLSIPAIDLQQNLKETQFKTISKKIAEDILNTILNQDSFIEDKSQSMGLVFGCVSTLQYFLLHTPRAYIDPFKQCKEKLIKHAILDCTDNLHEIVVQEKETSLDLSQLQEEYTYLFIKLFSCTNLLNQLDEIYCESFIQKCLEITDTATSYTSTDNTCIYTFTSLGLQLDFYLNVLRVGLSESCQKTSRLEEYLKYRQKVIKQLWLFLREEKKKAIQFNLETSEYKKILFKSYYSVVEGLAFVCNQKLKHLPIYIKLHSDDPLFTSLIDYISYYIPQGQIGDEKKLESNENSNDHSNNNDIKNKIMEAEKEDENKLKLKPFEESYLFQQQYQNQKQISDIQIILLQFCKLTLSNPKFIHSQFGVYIFKNFFDCQNKEIVDLLRKNLACCRLQGDKQSGFPPFWRAFDEIVNQLLDEGKDMSVIKKFVVFTHKSYFSETINEGNVQVKPKEHFKELCERQIYFLTAKTAVLINTPNKLNTLNAIGYLLQIKINYPKSLDPNHLMYIQSLQKKYQTFFLKKTQDYVQEFKQNNQHLQSLDETILSEKSKEIIYRYVKNLESWSQVKFNVDPYGEGQEALEKQREQAERSLKKEQKQENADEKSDLVSESEDEEVQDQDQEESVEEKNNTTDKKQSHKSKQVNKKTRSSSRSSSKNQKSSKKMDENKQKPTSSVKKTKKEQKSSVKINIKQQQEESSKVETVKKNHRRQKKN